MKREYRYNLEHRIDFVSCDNNCPKKGAAQQIVIFNRRAKLREHTVKHLVSKINKPKITLGDVDEDNIQKCRELLENIGCPYYNSVYENPPCFIHQRNCPSNKCLEIKCLNDLEDKYTDIILEDLKKCATLPRYACYYEKNEQRIGWMLSAISDRWLAIHSHWMKEHGKYNLTSCYLSKKPHLSFEEFCDKEAEKIINKAKKGSIVFCKKENWLIKIALGDLKEKVEPKKRQKPLTQMQIAFMKAGMLIDEIKRKKRTE